MPLGFKVIVWWFQPAKALIFKVCILISNLEHFFQNIWGKNMPYRQVLNKPRRLNRDGKRKSIKKDWMCNMKGHGRILYSLDKKLCRWIQAVMYDLTHMVNIYVTTRFLVSMLSVMFLYCTPLILHSITFSAHNQWQQVQSLPSGEIKTIP